jgi:diguanylate cyclase (GGDEF)-like protein
MDAQAVAAVMGLLSRFGSVSVARLDEEGGKVEAIGFLGEALAPAAAWKSPALPEFTGLAIGAQWHGTLELDAPEGGTLRLPCAMVRTDGGFLLAAERETDDVETLGKAAVRLSNELAQTREELASARRELDQRDDQVRALSFVDGITGLGNRRAFHQSLSSEILRSRRYGSKLALVLAAIDGLDTLAGHQGEERAHDTLRCFARVVCNATRQTDQACRLGENRFALMLPQTEPERAESVAERIRLAFAAAAPGIAGGTVTASFGHAAWGVAEDPSSLLQRADAALASAQGAGGNRVLAA